MLKRRTSLNDLARHESYLNSHLQEISKRCRISPVLIGGIIAGRRTWVEASDAELQKAASYVDKNDADAELDEGKGHENQTNDELATDLSPALQE
jgi:hypothetical protein